MSWVNECTDVDARVHAHTGAVSKSYRSDMYMSTEIARGVNGSYALRRIRPLCGPSGLDNGTPNANWLD